MTPEIQKCSTLRTTAILGCWKCIGKIDEGEWNDGEIVVWWRPKIASYPLSGSEVQQADLAPGLWWSLEVYLSPKKMWKLDVYPKDMYTSFMYWQPSHTSSQRNEILGRTTHPVTRSVARRWLHATKDNMWISDTCDSFLGVIPILSNFFLKNSY